MSANFFTFDLKDYPCLAPLIPLTREVANLNDLGDVEDFKRKTKDDELFRRCRDECFREPEYERMLRAEANGALRRQARAMSDRVESVSHPKFKKSFGHYAFNDPQRITHIQYAVDLAFQASCENVGDFLYPPFGFRGWHTNKYDQAGWAIYLVQTDKMDGSFFRYIDPDTGGIVTHWDRPDSCNIFKIETGRPFWHCIVSEDGYRWSQGFRLPEDWRCCLEIAP